MTVDTMSTLRNYLVSTSTVTAQVSSSNIKVGYQGEINSYPSIILYQTGGLDHGYMGYNTNTAGNKLRLETSNITIDILSRTSMYHTYEIADVILPVMISGGCRKVQDKDLYDDDSKVHRKVLVFKTQRHQAD